MKRLAQAAAASAHSGTNDLLNRTNDNDQLRSGVTMVYIWDRVMFLGLFGFLFAALSFVQVPQWDNDWTKCSVFVPDTACHWYVVNPDNTFGKGFSWITAPEYDVAALRDIAAQHDITVQQGYQTTVDLMNAGTVIRYGDDY